MRPDSRHMWVGAITAAAMLFMAVLLAGATAPAQAGPPEDAVIDWNAYASDALINAPTAATPGVGESPPVASIGFAMMHGAIYDAVNMIAGGYEPYLDDLPPAPANASKPAAVATAAHDVLVGVVQGVPLAPPLAPPLTSTIVTNIVTRLDGLRNASLAAIPDSAAKTNGIAAGAAAAQEMLRVRAGDGRFGPFRFTPGDDAGEWRPVLPAFVSDPFAWVARVTPFMLESTSQFRTKGPHSLTSGAYAKEYNEVKELGGNGTTTPTSRTDEQTAMARFFVLNPLEMYNRAFRSVSGAHGLTLVDQARLFAMVNMAGADSLINCWDDKAFWSFWRPITAIQQGDNDGNHKTVGDPAWLPLFATPPYPDHPSGYNCFTGGFMHTAEVFFGRGKTPFSLTGFIGTPPVPVTRNYERFTDVIDDTIDARIYTGFHFRTPDAQGAGIGKDVAHWLDTHYFQPVK